MAVPLRRVQNFSPEDILYYRIITALLLLGAFILIFRRKALCADIQHYRSLTSTSRIKVLSLTVLASLLIFGNWYAYIYAVNHISIQSAAFAYLICPLLTAVTAFVILKEQLSFTKKLSLFLAFISVLMLATGSITEVLWSVSIGALYAFYLIIQRVVQGFDKLNILAIQLLLCSLFVIPKLLFDHNPIPTETVFWVTISVIALIFTIIPLFLSMFALVKISSTTAGVLLYINPLIAFTLAVVYFKEDFDPHKYMAYGIIMLAILLFNWESVNHLRRR